MKQNESALVCLSGGQDSTTCLYWALKEFRHVETVCFSYGQKHALEVDVARRIAEKASVDFSLLDLSLLGQITHNALTDNAVSMDKEKPAGALPNTFVPGRNMLFLTLAAIKAYERNRRFPNRFQWLSRLSRYVYPFVERLPQSGYGQAICHTYTSYVARQGAGMGNGR